MIITFLLLFIYSADSKVFVALTFDDNLKDHYDISFYLDTKNIKGTFYVNSGRLNTSGQKYATFDMMDSVYKRGHEFGGHTVDHLDLRTLNNTQRMYQVCNDKATLEKLGWIPKTFAFPFSGNYPGSNGLLNSCGYTIGRVSNGIEINVDCDGCPKYLNLPLNSNDVLNIRSISYRRWYTLSDIENNILTAQANTDDNTYALIVFVFHGIVSPTLIGASNDTITIDNFKAFIDWMASQNNIAIVTMGDVMTSQNYEQLYQSNLFKSYVSSSISDTNTPITTPITTPLTTSTSVSLVPTTTQIATTQSYSSFISAFSSNLASSSSTTILNTPTTSGTVIPTSPQSTDRTITISVSVVCSVVGFSLVSLLVVYLVRKHIRKDMDNVIVKTDDVFDKNGNELGKIVVVQNSLYAQSYTETNTENYGGLKEEDFVEIRIN